MKRRRDQGNGGTSDPEYRDQGNEEPERRLGTANMNRANLLLVAALLSCSFGPLVPGYQSLGGAPASCRRVPYRTEKERAVQRVQVRQQRGNLGQEWIAQD